jgi:hypothetical protein
MFEFPIRSGNQGEVRSGQQPALMDNRYWPFSDLLAMSDLSLQSIASGHGSTPLIYEYTPEITNIPGSHDQGSH